MLATLNSSPSTSYFQENPDFNVNLLMLARLKSFGALAETSSSVTMVHKLHSTCISQWEILHLPANADINKTGFLLKAFFLNPPLPSALLL